MVSLRTTEACKDLVKETICENIRLKDRLTYGQIGKVAVMILGTANLEIELYFEIMTRFKDNVPWEQFIRRLQWSSAQEISQAKELDRAYSFYEALKCTYNVNWIKEIDYISPSCFMYLVERLLLLASCRKGLMFASKSSFIEWLNYQDENSLANLSLTPGMIDIHEFLARVLPQLTYDQNGTVNWIKKSNLDVKNSLPLFVLRLVVSLCLLHLSTGKYLEPLRNLFGMSHITSQLPLEFCNVLKKGRKNLGLKVFADAFKVIDNPLVIIKLNNSSEIACPDAVFVDFKVCRQKELILQMLFPNTVDNMGGLSEAIIVESSDSTSKKFPSTNCSSLPSNSSASVSNSGIKDEINMSVNVVWFWDSLKDILLMIDSLCDDRGCPETVKAVKCKLDPLIQVLTSISGSSSEIPAKLKNKNEMGEVLSLLDEMKQLSSALNVGDSVIENHTFFGGLSKKFFGRRQKVERIMNELFLLWKRGANVEIEPPQASTATSSGDQWQNVLEESKDNMSKNSQGKLYSQKCEEPSLARAGDLSCASVSNQISDGGIKDVSTYTDFDLFWDSLENTIRTIDNYCVNNSIMPKDLLNSFNLLLDLFDPCIEILTSIRGSLLQIPVNLQNVNETEEVMSLLDEMKQLHSALNVSDSVIKTDILVELMKQIHARRQNVEHTLNELLLWWKNAYVEVVPSQTSTAAGSNDQAQRMSKNSQGAANSSGHGNRENTTGKRNKPKKNKGGKKGRK